MRAARNRSDFLNSRFLSLLISSSPSSIESAAMLKASATLLGSAPSSIVLSTARAAWPSLGSARSTSTRSSSSASLRPFLASPLSGLAAGSRVSSTAATFFGRACSLFWSSFWARSSSSLPTQPRGAVALGTGASLVSWAMATSTALSPGKAGLPVRTSNINVPNE